MERIVVFFKYKYVNRNTSIPYSRGAQIIASTREYMSDRLVRPVLKRADSVKAIRDAMLDSQVSVYAAHRIDGAIDAADKYVERFLPDDTNHSGGSGGSGSGDGSNSDCVDGHNGTAAGGCNDDGAEGGEGDDDRLASRPVHTLHKGKRFSKKLKRRLTQRTISEARALQHGSREAVHIVRYACELLVRDPRQAYRRAGELWQYLSDEEPDNQARPRTLEQLIVLVVREAARKAVHLTNYVVRTTAKIPRLVRVIGIFAK